jgi:ADP-ribose pyrophosphatase YjhB (NUDIX family)
MTQSWLSPTDYARIQQTMPIPCIDILPLRLHSPTTPTTPQVGLILRNTPENKNAWCLVGGRLFRNESIAQCITRQLHQTLGPNIRFQLGPDPQPLYIAQYFPTPRPANEPHCIDLRQHSLALTFAIPIEGTPTAQDEALNFQWFPLNALPAPTDFGFNQDRIVATCLAKLPPF